MAIIEKGKIAKYGNIDVKLLDDVPIEVLGSVKSFMMNMKDKYERSTK